MNRVYEFYNPNSLAGIGGQPERFIFCKHHAKEFKRTIRRMASTFSFEKKEKTEEECGWCANPEEFIFD